MFDLYLEHETLGDYEEGKPIPGSIFEVNNKLVIKVNNITINEK
jgi:hypothetical protein